MQNSYGELKTPIISETENYEIKWRLLRGETAVLDVQLPIFLSRRARISLSFI